MKLSNIIEVYPIIDKAILSKMEITDRFIVIKTLRSIKKIVDDFNSFREDSVNRLKPENYDKVVEIIQRFNTMNEEEKQEAFKDEEIVNALTINGKFNQDIELCFQSELSKEIDLDIKYLSEDAFSKLIESNSDWKAGDIMKCEDLLCKK